MWSSSSEGDEPQPRRASITHKLVVLEKKKKPGNRAGFGTSAGDH